jgi:FtsH-binding integral membrane protein
MEDFRKPGTGTIHWDEKRASDIDTGLRNYMNGIYRQMTFGLMFAALIAGVIGSSPVLINTIATSGLMFVFMFAILGLGFITPKIIMSKSMGAAHGMFWLTTGLWGVFLSPVAIIYSGADILNAFLSTTIAFAGMSLVGYTTKKDLTPLGNFLGLAVWGILGALLINIFFIQSSGFELILSVIVVLVFSGLTAYETQNLKSMYFQVNDENTRDRMSILGALSLFGNFVTIFIWMLNLMGNNE